MKEQLLGYLLGALEVEETLFVEQLLVSDAEAQSHLELLRLALAPLDPLRQEVNAPDGPPWCCQRVREVRLMRLTAACGRPGRVQAPLVLA
jgi:anti-sigma-K factor RskA